MGLEKFRKYANAFEMAVETKETDETIEGWSDIIKKDTALLEQVTKMVDNKDTPEGRKISVLLCKHPKESVRYLCDKVMKGETFEVENRTHITL